MAAKSKKKFDSILLGSVFVLLCLGILILFSISAPFSQRTCGNTHCFLTHQLLFGIIPGLTLGFLAFKIDINFLKKWALPLFLINLVLVAAVFLPVIGLTKGGARRWLQFGPFSFQPAEPLKITLLVYLASWLSSQKKKNLKTLSFFFAILAPIILIMALQPDASTLGMIVLIAFLIYFLAGAPFWHSLLSIGLGVAGLLLLINLASYRMERLFVFVIPQLDPMGKGYQIKQALIAIGSGGIFGKGLGMSGQKFGFLPHPMSDSNFAIFCEEAGLIGALVLISLFLLFFSRGLKIAKNSKNNFAKLMAAGLSTQIILQAFLNIGAMTAILPLTGIPLPFISYGGTHLVVELIAVGLLLNISKNN